jgi:hypothetical protein
MKNLSTSNNALLTDEEQQQKISEKKQTLTDEAKTVMTDFVKASKLLRKLKNSEFFAQVQLHNNAQIFEYNNNDNTTRFSLQNGDQYIMDTEIVSLYNKQEEIVVQLKAHIKILSDSAGYLTQIVEFLKDFYAFIRHSRIMEAIKESPEVQELKIFLSALVVREKVPQSTGVQNLEHIEVETNKAGGHEAFLLRQRTVSVHGEDLSFDYMQ